MPGSGARVALRIKSFLKEPLLHFLLIGTALFVLFDMRSGSSTPAVGLPDPPSLQVTVTQHDIRQMTGLFEKTWQRAPTDTETQHLIETFIRDEIYYREALAAGLDRDDSLIRQRMRLKMEYLFEDIAAQVQPTDQQLQDFLNQQAESYRRDPKIGFRQVFVNSDRRGATAKADALLILTQLNQGIDPDTVGDSFLLGAQFHPTDLWEIKGQFGEPFAAALFELLPGRWHGPIQSAFGLHLVRVETRIEAQLPDLDAVREVVQRDWAVVNQQKLKDEAYARVRERYHVVVEPPQTDASTASAAYGLKAVN